VLLLHRLVQLPLQRLDDLGLAFELGVLLGAVKAGEVSYVRDLQVALALSLSHGETSRPSPALTALLFDSQKHLFSICA
jgi:hypothetical protein